MQNRPIVLKIERIIDETPTVKTFCFDHPHLAKAAYPGQFVMVWIPGIDEIPMGLSRINSNGSISITVERVGDATTALHNLKESDSVGIRGPYGRGFRIVGDRPLVIGGGVGISPLFPLIENMVEEQILATVVLGAKNVDKLIFVDQINSSLSGTDSDLLISTEDGSLGTRGFAPELAEKLLEEKSFDQIYTCGPELMIHKVFEIAEEKNISLQASLERIMKCGIGLCGSCCIGEYQVCKDGPVFRTDELRRLKGEFGLMRRDYYGRKEPIPK
ncbi:MAG: dihydroorotate dehydrogenase electron transfer subunit [Candidatus Hodarchaeota archaeon]